MWQTSPEKASREAIPRLGQIACQWRRPRKIRPDPTGIIKFLSSKTKQNIFDEFGGNSALERLRRRLDKRGRLLLDFVTQPHVSGPSLDTAHPEYYVRGNRRTTGARAAELHHCRDAGGAAGVAYGRSPYFPGWPNTLQLNYANPQCQEAMAAELRRSRRCATRFAAISPC